MHTISESCTFEEKQKGVLKHSLQGIELYKEFNRFLIASAEEAASSYARQHEIAKKFEGKIRDIAMMDGSTKYVILSILEQHSLLATMSSAEQKSFQESTKNRTKEIVEEITSSWKNIEKPHYENVLHSVRTPLETKRKRYEEAFHKAQKASYKYNKVKDNMNLTRRAFQTLKDDMKVKLDDFDNRKLDYQKAVENAKKEENAVCVHLMPHHINAYEKIDELRVTEIKESAKLWAEMNITYGQNNVRGMESIMATIDDVYPKLDLHLVENTLGEVVVEPKGLANFEDLGDPTKVDAYAKRRFNRQLKKQKKKENAIQGKSQDILTIERTKLMAEKETCLKERTALLKLKDCYEANIILDMPEDLEKQMERNEMALATVTRAIETNMERLQMIVIDNESDPDESCSLASDMMSSSMGSSMTSSFAPSFTSEVSEEDTNVLDDGEWSDDESIETETETETDFKSSFGSITSTEDGTKCSKPFSSGPSSKPSIVRRASSYLSTKLRRGFSFARSRPAEQSLSKNAAKPMSLASSRRSGAVGKKILGIATARYAYNGTCEAMPMSYKEVLHIIGRDYGNGLIRVRRITNSEEGFVPMGAVTCKWKLD